MSYTNSTPYYGLPQFIGTDIPSWLDDFNGAMSKIDTGINSALTQANTANTKATTADNKADLASTSATKANDGVTAVNARIDNMISDSSISFLNAVPTGNLVNGDCVYIYSKNKKQGAMKVWVNFKNPTPGVATADGNYFYGAFNLVGNPFNLEALTTPTWGKIFLVGYTNSHKIDSTVPDTWQTSQIRIVPFIAWYNGVSTSLGIVLKEANTSYNVLFSLNAPVLLSGSLYTPTNYVSMVNELVSKGVK